MMRHNQEREAAAREVVIKKVLPLFAGDPRPDLDREIIAFYTGENGAQNPVASRAVLIFKTARAIYAENHRS